MPGRAWANAARSSSAVDTSATAGPPHATVAAGGAGTGGSERAGAAMGACGVAGPAQAAASIATSATTLTSPRMFTAGTPGYRSA
ncbi:MAG: hypothetical protein ACRDUV_07005 [Pseudonocardiaceae bacterium]